MRDDFNPYQSPEAAELPSSSAEEVVQRGLSRFALIGWPIALGANLPVPLLFGSALTERSGRWGMSLAILVFFGLGYLICYYWPGWSRRFVSVSFLFALTQFVPIIQMIAGMISIGVSQQLPFVGRIFATNDGSPDEITSELAGFVVSIFCGGLLCLIVAGLALLFGVFSSGSKSGKNLR